MEKIINLNTIKLINAKCLVEVVGRFNLETDSGIHIGEEVVKYNQSDHAVRFGKLVKMPDNINWNKSPWKTDSFPKVGDDVFFDYLEGKDATIVEHNGKKLMVLPYFKLFLSRSPNGSIKLLNGYLLAQKYPKTSSKVIEHKQQYYDDIYTIKYAGKPNINYKVEKSLNGDVIQHIDDPSIMEGGVYMTRASAYPVLEESPHNKFSKETYYLMQRKDIVALVDEL